MLRLQKVQIRGLLILFLNGCSHPVWSVISLLSLKWKLGHTRDLSLSSCLRHKRKKGDREQAEGGELWALALLKVDL